MKYSIGEFASLLGVTADTLRLYEKHDIIRPVKTKHNNYRYFNDLDARNLLSSRWYRSMQIPLQSVTELINDAPSNQVVTSIDTARMLLEKITEIHHELELVGESFGTCQIRQVPGIYRIQQTDKNQLLQKERLRRTVHGWMELLPFTFYSFLIKSSENICADGELDYSWGLALLESDQKKLEVRLNDCIEYLQPATCISSVIVTGWKENFERETFQFMLDYARENQYALTGDIYGKILFTEHVGNVNKTYLEINIPVNPPAEHTLSTFC